MLVYPMQYIPLYLHYTKGFTCFLKGIFRSILYSSTPKCFPCTIINIENKSVYAAVF